MKDRLEKEIKEKNQENGLAGAAQPHDRAGSASISAHNIDSHYFQFPALAFS